MDDNDKTYDDIFAALTDPATPPYDITDGPTVAIDNGDALIGHIDHGPVCVSTYWHTPTDGRKPYLVVDIDSADDDPPLVVYVNDGAQYENFPA